MKGTGKTSLLQKFKSGEFNEEYVPRQVLGSHVLCRFDDDCFFDSVKIDMKDTRLE